MFCKNCGSAVNDDQTFCVNCGAAQVVEKPGNPKLNGKDDLTVALFCAFLGGFGVHNFVMGETKKGIIKIVLTLCCGLGGLLALYDLVKLVMYKYEADPEKFI